MTEDSCVLIESLWRPDWHLYPTTQPEKLEGIHSAQHVDLQPQALDPILLLNPETIAGSKGPNK